MTFPRTALIVAMGLGFAVTAGDPAIFSSDLPDIARELGMTASQSGTLASVATLVIAATILAAGSFGDRWGKVRLFRIGLIAGMLFAVAGAVAPNAPVLVAARVGAGAAFAVLLGLSLAIVNAAFPGEDRPRAIGSYLSVAFLAGAPMVLLGGVLTQALSWRASLLVTAVYCAAGLLLLIRMPETPTSSQRIDVPGLVLAAVMLVCIVYGVGLVTAAPVIGVGLVAVGAAAGAVFVIVEKRSSSPALDLSVFRSRTFTLAVAAGGSFNLLTGGFTLVLSYYLVVVEGNSTVVFGLVVLVASVAQAVGANIAGRLTTSAGPRLPLLLGLASLVASCGVFAMTRLDSGLVMPLLGFTLLALGNAFVQTPQSTLMMAAAGSERGGSVSAVKSGTGQAFYSLGPAVFTLLVVSIYTSRSGSALQSHGISAEQARAVLQPLLSGTAGQVGGPGLADPALVETVVGVASSSFVDAMRLTSVLAAIVPLGVGLAMVFLLPRGRARHAAAAQHEVRGGGA